MAILHQIFLVNFVFFLSFYILQTVILCQLHICWINLKSHFSVHTISYKKNTQKNPPKITQQFDAALKRVNLLFLCFSSLQSSQMNNEAWYEETKFKHAAFTHHVFGNCMRFDHIILGRNIKILRNCEQRFKLIHGYGVCFNCVPHKNGREECLLKQFIYKYIEE